MQHKCLLCFCFCYIFGFSGDVFQNFILRSLCRLERLPRDNHNTQQSRYKLDFFHRMQRPLYIHIQSFHNRYCHINLFKFDFAEKGKCRSLFCKNRCLLAPNASTVVAAQRLSNSSQRTIISNAIVVSSNPQYILPSLLHPHCGRLTFLQTFPLKFTTRSQN